MVKMQLWHINLSQNKKGGKNMERFDNDLGFLLKYENVAWYENGIVKILDRRIYPTQINFVECKTHIEVAQAITDMVTQSAGPYTAAAMGMALAGYECKDKTKAEQVDFLTKAAHTIANARPTTANRMGQITNGSLEAAKKALEIGECPIEAMKNDAVESLNRRYKTMQIVGENLVRLFPKDAVILTQCFGETIVGMMLRAAKNKGLNVKVYCAETRPYLQGARLTSSVCKEMGFDTTVISDNMIAYAMKYCNINVFTSAADTIARDGSIANKIGTFQIATLAKSFGIPYFVTGIPDIGKMSGDDIIIEQRDPSDVLCYRGIKNTLDGVKAIYPSFDITPPSLVSGVVTDKGIYSAFDLNNYFETPTDRFY